MITFVANANIVSHVNTFFFLVVPVIAFGWIRNDEPFFREIQIINLHALKETFIRINDNVDFFIS
ncbi:hypothetical protein D3C73_1603980 [compost metagenome]